MGEILLVNPWHRFSNLLLLFDQHPRDQSSTSNWQRSLFLLFHWLMTFTHILKSRKEKGLILCLWALTQKVRGENVAGWILVEISISMSKICYCGFVAQLNCKSYRMFLIQKWIFEQGRAKGMGIWSNPQGFDPTGPDRNGMGMGFKTKTRCRLGFA